MDNEIENIRMLTVDEMIDKAESNKQIRAYQCHYCQHSNERYGEEVSSCKLGISPERHILADANRCRAEFQQYEWYDRETRQIKAISIPDDCYDRRYKSSEKSSTPTE